MPDKKLTDKEIVKVLECCSKPVGENCKECPLHLTDCLKVNIDELTLDLINRLQAENEKNEKIIRLADMAIETANAEIKRVRGELETTKAEALKEFVYDLMQIPNVSVYKYEIKNLLKEKLGEE